MMQANKGTIMALEIRSIPVLTGETAERFVREAEENERNPQRRKLLFSFEDIDRMMERSRKYLKDYRMDVFSLNKDKIKVNIMRHKNYFPTFVRCYSII